MLLELTNLDAFYGDSHILHGVSLTVREGEGLALLGRNGAGKTTLLKSIMAAGPRVAGGIAFDGKALGGMPTHRRARAGISLVPEDRRLFPHLSVEANLVLAQQATRPGETPLQPAEVARLFPMLADLMARRGHALSGGQQQMVAVARGLVPKPRLMLLDEPAEGLAPVIVDQLSDEIAASRAAQSYALILTEQNISFARACTDRVAVLDTGRLVFAGTWDTFDASDAAKNHLAL
jgi:branched-chain amino acid transport system ATP-binding protein